MAAPSLDLSEFGGDAPQLDLSEFQKPQKAVGALSYIGQQAKAGLTADLPTIAGKALQYAGASDIGSRMRAFGEANAQSAQPDENQGAITKLAAGAIRGAAPIIPLAVGGLAANAFAPEVAVPLELAGAAGLAGGFGGAQAQDTFEKAKAAGLSDEAATSVARKTGLITGVGMGAVGALTGGIAAPALRGIAGAGAKTAAESLAETASPSIARSFLADTAGHLVGNVTSMAAANAGTAAVEQQAGLPGPTPGQAALEGVESGAGLTAALLPFGLARTALARRANTAAVSRLQSPDTDPQQRAAIAAQIHANLSAIDPEAAGHFAQNVAEAIDGKQPLELGPHLLGPQEAAPQPAAPLALRAPVVRVDEQGNARMDGVPPPVQDEPAANLVGRQDVTDVEAKPTRSEAMGLNPDDGPISRAAVIAVDSGAHDQAVAQAAQAAAEEATTKTKGKPNESTQAAPAQAGLPLQADAPVAAGVVERTPANGSTNPASDRGGPALGSSAGADVRGDESVRLQRTAAPAAEPAVTNPAQEKLAPAPRQSEAIAAPAEPQREAVPAEPKRLQVGITPGNAEPVTIKDGIVHIGKEPALDFNSGEPVRVKDGASDADVKQVLKDSGSLSRRQKFFGGEAEVPDNKMPVGRPALPQPPRFGIDGTSLDDGGKPFANRIEAGKFQQKHNPSGRVVKVDGGFAIRDSSEKEDAARRVAGNRLQQALRQKAYEENPLKAFVAQHGLAPELASEFAPGIRERQAANVRGYPQTFRKGGLQMDALAERAAQDGFLPPNDYDANRLYDLVARAMRGERIVPIYAEGQAEKEMQAHIKAQQELHGLEPHDLDAEGYDRASEQLQSRVREIMAGVPDEQREAILEDAAKRTENATDEEYLAAVREAIKAAVPSAGEAGAQDRGGPHGAAGAEPAQGKAEGLTAPTPAEVLAQQSRKESAPALQAKEQITREAAKQTLTQPVAPEQRKDTTGDLLGGPSKEEALAAKQKAEEAKAKPKEDNGTTPMFSRKKDETRDLIVQHNITAENVLHAQRMGGMAVPSIAITKAAHPMRNFGEITLLGDKNMATPKGDTKVFGADIYSPRYPTVQYKPDAVSLKRIRAILEPFHKEGEYRLSELRTIDDLTGDKAFRRYAAEQIGKGENGGSYSEIRAEAEKLAREAGAEERIFQGFTYSGNRRYKAHTLDNVITILKKELRGGENFNYGAGSLRAKFTPQFRSIAAIKAAKDKLIEKEAFEKLKDEVNKELLDLSYDMVPDRGFHSSDTAISILEDGAKMGLRRAAKEYGVELSDEQVQRAAEFMTKLRNMPTEYFEGKITRSVGLGEFKAAIVPDDLHPDARKALEDAGLTLHEYKRGNEEDRKRTVQAAAQSTPDAMFSRGEVEGTPLRTPEIRKALAPALDSLKVPYDLHDSAAAAKEATGVEIPSDAKGMYYGGKLHLIAEGIKNPLEAEETLWHEVNHAGIDQIYRSTQNTKDYYNAMRGLALQNANIREAAKEWLKNFGADDTKARIAAGMTRDAAELRTKLQAVEEALSQLAGKNAKINGAVRFIAKVQEFMRAVGLNRLADSLEKMTDAQALSMIFRAREAVMKEPQPTSGAQLAPAFSKDNETNFSKGHQREVQIDGQWHPIENSKGQLIHPDVEGQRNFWKWFGASAVKDESGRPIPVFHGTGRDFSEFKTADERAGGIRGTYFAENPTLAGMYAEQHKGGEAVYPVYLSIKNPIDAAEIRKYGYDKGVHFDDATQHFADLGYDGAFENEPHHKGGGARVWVAFSPNQIKSAIGNRGTFDANEANISFSRSLDAASDTLDRIKNGIGAKPGGSLHGIVDGLMLATMPDKRSVEAGNMGAQLRLAQGLANSRKMSDRAALNRAVAETTKAVTLAEKARDALSMGMTKADKLFVGKPQEDNFSFMQAMDTADKSFLEKNPALKAVADVMARLWNERAELIQKLDTGALQNLRENYFRHMWKQEPDADTQRQIFSTLSKRPFGQAPGSFKERFYEDFMAGVKAGLKPVSDNPMDIFALSMHELDKYIIAHGTLKALEGTNGVHLIAAGEKTPKGYTDINGRFGNIERNGEKLRYVARDDVAQVVNNYVSQSLYHNKYVGSAFSKYMGAANTLNQFQLGVFSAFHAGFTSMEAVISHGALGVKAASEGDFKGAVKYLGTAPAAWLNNPRLGDKILAEWLNRGSHPEVAHIIAALEMAGARFEMDQRFRTDYTRNMMQAWGEGKKFKAGLNSIGAVAEQTARPILEWLVPRQKAGVFGEMWNRWTEQNPKATHEEMLKSAQQIWNRVDSRLGQVVYDRLFVHNVAKNFAQMLIRAPGWTGGTILEVGGGIVDLAKYAKDLPIAIAKGEKPAAMTDRAAYTFSMLMVTALANAAMTAMFTGDSPQDWRDLVAFRTGNLDEHGRPERFMFPTYMKDVHAYLNAPGTTLLNKSHPLLSLIGDVGRNRDFYGTEIRSEDANILTQLAQTAGFTAKAFVPFWVKGLQKEQEREGSALAQAAPLVGVMPAPSDLNKTAAEKLMTKYGADKMPQGSRTQEEADKADLRRKMMLALRKGEQDKAKDLFDEGREKGLFGARDYLKVVRQARQDPLVSQFSHLTYDQAQRVMKAASDDEKQELAPAFMKKRLAFQRQHQGATD